MSATNRGAVRSKNDFYETPQDCILNFLKHHPIDPNAVILDPCVGTGAFPKALRMAGYTNQIDTIEIDSNFKAVPEASNHHCEDFLQLEPPYKYDVIFSNPPYSLAEEFIKKAFTLANKEKFEIIYLLRLNFLGAQKRNEFWQEYPPNKLYVLSKRPSFTGGSTDACEYCYYVWDTSGTQEIHVIEGE